MGRFLIAAVAAGVIAWSSVPGYAANSQQDKMTACNQQAATEELSGDARKSFMSSCMSGNGMTTAASSKTTSCNSQADAKKLSGAARTSFVKKCAAS